MTSISYLPLPVIDDGVPDRYLRHLTPPGVACVLAAALPFVADGAPGDGVVYLQEGAEVRGVVGDPAELRAAGDEVRLTGHDDGNPARCDVEALRSGVWTRGYCFGAPEVTLPPDWFLLSPPWKHGLPATHLPESP